MLGRSSKTAGDEAVVGTNLPHEEYVNRSAWYYCKNYFR